jgi:hypothetical protein
VGLCNSELRLQYSVELPGVQFHGMVWNHDEQGVNSVDLTSVRAGVQRCNVFENDLHPCLFTSIEFKKL